METAAQIYRCIRGVWEQQPELGELRLYSTWNATGLITQFPANDVFMKIADFKALRQAYYLPGAAAAFLADYAMRVNDPAPLALARDMMQLNINGCADQFTDRASVQICKFGWGAAQLLVADPDGGWLSHTLKMADWFCDRQEEDGSWLPSAFSLKAEPTDMDKMWKTAEHLMEACLLGAAISGRCRPARLGKANIAGSAGFEGRRDEAAA
jgi:hypothetical protein